VSDPSNFWKTIATDADTKRQYFKAPTAGKKFFDVRLGDDSDLLSECPWDVVDYMSVLFYTKYYAPREIDGVFSMMLIQAGKTNYSHFNV
jgi:hypothetical protein